MKNRFKQVRSLLQDQYQTTNSFLDEVNYFRKYVVNRLFRETNRVFIIDSVSHGLKNEK
jgi:hypothetical protein